MDSWDSFNKQLEDIYTRYAVVNIPDSTTMEENDWFGPIANIIFSTIMIIINITFINKKKNKYNIKNPYEEDYKNALKGNDKYKALGKYNRLEVGELVSRQSRICKFRILATYRLFLNGMKPKFDDNDFRKGVILYGLNQATYKIALGKSLIELDSLNKEVIDWNELLKSFFENYIERFKNEHLPQQSNSSRI